VNALRADNRFTLVLSWLLAVGTVVAIASTDSIDALLDAAGHLHPEWFALALGAELIAYAGYVVAYRSSAHAPGRPRLPLALTVRLVVAGFGPFVALGGFALDRRALGAVHDDDRAARVHVLGLGVIEYALLAPAAWASALALQISGSPRTSPALTLPWLIAVPLGLAGAVWVSAPGRRRRWAGKEGRLRELRSDALSGLAMLRGLISHPLEHPGALVGMALYWSAEIACLGAALACFGIKIPVAALVLAHATGYSFSRRSMPLGGAGLTEALLTVSLIWVQVPAPVALLSVVVYRLVNFLAPTVPGLFAHATIRRLLESRPEALEEEARVVDQRLRRPQES
jgi:uncharacterized membrane protein YbhN (UPF0104 family)